MIIDHFSLLQWFIDILKWHVSGNLYPFSCFSLGQSIQQVGLNVKITQRYNVTEDNIYSTSRDCQNTFFFPKRTCVVTCKSWLLYLYYHFSHPSDTLGAVPYMTWIIYFTVHHTWLMTPLPGKKFLKNWLFVIRYIYYSFVITLLQY